MILTKYAHACFVVEKGDSSLIIDPGNWSQDLVIPPNVTGIVITHQHADHCDATQLRKIIDTNPAATIYAPSEVTKQLQDLPTQAVTAGETVQAGEFVLSFTGGEHAQIHSSIPVIENLGVWIDDTVYYPGDSFTLPGKDVAVLALPVSAPWMKLGEAVDFLLEVRPARCFPTHDAILSKEGQSLADTMLTAMTGTAGVAYKRIDTGTSIEL